MLKNIGILAIIFLSTSAYSQEYEVQIFDSITNEVAIETCANTAELNEVTREIADLNDGALKFSVRKIGNSIGIMRARMGGGEGSGD